MVSANEIVRRVMSAPWFEEATTISCYLSMPTGEVDTSAVASAVLQSGTHLLFPFPFPLISFASLIPLDRKEFVRTERWTLHLGRDGCIQSLRRRGPALAAERGRLGH